MAMYGTTPEGEVIKALEAELDRQHAKVEWLRKQYAEAIDDLRAVNAHRSVIDKHEAALRGGEEGG